MVKKLSINLLLTFIISCFISFIGIEIYTSDAQSSLEGNQANFIMLLANIFLCLVLTICSSTIFLNKVEKIKTNKFYSFLSFFLLPVIATCIFIYSLCSNDQWGIFLLSSLAFYFPHTYFYMKFLLGKR
jgi:divalent metal cation (Fe/Co/Zn/Cd) transporter